MRIVHFADLHLDTPFLWASREFGRTKRQRLREVLGRIAALAIEVTADALLCAGDLYEHDRVVPDTAQFIRQTFERLHPLPVYIAPGNHDWLGPESLYSRASWSPNVHVFDRDQLRPVTLTDGITLWGAAHRAPANTDDFLRGFATDRGGVHLALFHGSERSRLPYQDQGKIPHAPFDASTLERSGIQHAFLGHYHLPIDAERYTYPGNPEPLSFGEEGDRGAVIATIESDGTVTHERRRVSLSATHDLHVDVTGSISQQDVRDRLAAALSGLRGAVRVVLVGEIPPDLDFQLRDLTAPPDVEAFVVRAGSIAVGYDYDAIEREQTVRGQFVRDVRAAVNLTDEDRRRVLMTGLRALAGRSDLEVP